MTRKAIVTGGAGFVGSHLVDLLVDRGWEVLVVDDLSTGALENLAGARARGKVGVHVTGIRAPELTELAERFGPEVVFHLAAQVKVPASVADPVRDAAEHAQRDLRPDDAARPQEDAADGVPFAAGRAAAHPFR